MRPYSSLASSFGSSACGPIGLSCGAGDYSAASIAALSCSLGASAGSGVLSAGSMGLLARACSRGGVWLDGGRRVTATLMLAAGAQVLATPALAQQTCTSTNWQDGGTLPGTGVADVSGAGTCVSGTVVNNGGTQNVYNSGVASGTVVSNGGQQIVLYGGVASGTVVSNGGRQYVLDDGVASGTVISNGGRQEVWDNGTATNTIINDGGKQVISNGGVASGDTVSDDGLYDSHCSNGDIACIRGGGSQVVSQGGKAENVYVLAGGLQYVSAGGEAINTSMYGGGEQTVSGSSAQALGGAIGSGGSQNVMSDGVATSAQVLSAGAQFVFNGGVALATTVKEDGTQYVYSSGTAQDTMLEGGTMHISTGGILLDKLSGYGTVKNEDALRMSSGGLVAITASGGSEGAEKTLVISKRIEAANGTYIRAFEHTSLSMAYKPGMTDRDTIGGAGTLDLKGGTIEAGEIKAGALSADDNSANTLRTSGGGNAGVTISGNVSAGYVTVEGDYFAVDGDGTTTIYMPKGKVTGKFRAYAVSSGNLGTTEIEGHAEFRSAILTGGVYKKNIDLDAVSQMINAAVSASSAGVGRVYGSGTITATSSGTMTVEGKVASSVKIDVQANGNMAVSQLEAGTPSMSIGAGGVLALGKTGQTQADFTRLRSHASGGGVVALQGLNAPDATIAPAGAANTLVVEQGASTVASIGSFENLHFILSSALTAGGVALSIAGGSPTVFAQMTKIGVAVAGGARPLRLGESVTLIRNDAGLKNGGNDTLTLGADYQQVSLSGRQGISLEYDFTLSNTDNTIDATVSRFQPVQPPKPTPTPTPPQPQPVPPQPVPPTPPGPQVNPQTKAIPEGRVAGMGMLNLGADQIVRMTGNLPNRTGGGGVFDRSGGPLGRGTNGAGGGNANGAGAPSDTTAFARLSGYDQKVMTGSHVNVNGATAIVGAAKVLPLAGGGTAAVGAFFEYGDGSFKTHNGFDTGDVNGKGNSDYYGAGVLARVNLAPRGSADGGGAPFVEGSLHAGRIHNNWHTDDLRDAATGARAQYDIRTPYLGGHVGAGYRWQTNDTTQVEVFGQYLYTHMDGKDTTVALDPYHFNAVKSSRTRIGAKGTWAVSQQAQAYAGAAWEREFDGTARATAYSFDVPAPTMKGNSAVIDAGLSFQPKRNLTTNVGVTGYAGKRRGAAANVEVQYLF